jgi:(2S)-methylsuccinyl-CoA dehydrogenase
LEQLIAQAAFGEYLAQLAGGIALSQSETARPIDVGIDRGRISALTSGAAGRLIDAGNTDRVRGRIAQLLAHQPSGGDAGISDDTLLMMRDQARRFIDTKVTPLGQEWHNRDMLIPIEVVDGLGQLGVFGLTIAEDHGGLGLGKLAMCIVTEELSRGNLGVGSLVTRSEIAAEMIGANGTPDQKREWLPRIASGETLPAAVFTEPGAGSDLGSLQTRAVAIDGGYSVTGNKTWITHAARADLMVILARTGTIAGNRGLSIFLAAKQRGSDEAPFPDKGLSGGEIPVLGYRGMKEYELAFDDYRVGPDALLGAVENNGFRQLMATFESARIQTAARAVGVAQNALELALAYATERRQFDKPLLRFPRIAGKLGWMAVETMIARQLTYHAARRKDAGHRCDIEAGMAKLLAARVAFANADSALQIHGGNGYAQEYAVSRVFCDARILSIFEGAAEIQAGIIARGILNRQN